MEADASEETSYIGNNADYKRWAKAVDGIGDAIVIPEWNGPETSKNRMPGPERRGSKQDPAGCSLQLHYGSR